MKIGKGIKKVLDERGVSQKKLAELIGKSETSVSLLIKDKTQPRKETINDIASVLKVPAELLFILSIEENDVPDSKKEHYEILWPTIEKSLMTLLKE